MGHADVVEHDVVPARGAVGVTVVPAQQGIEVVAAAVAHLCRARARHQRQIRRLGAEPCLGLLGIDGRDHQVPHLVGGEHQVFLDLLFGQPQLGQAVVAHERRRVAVQAVVDEDLGAVLQRRLIGGQAGGLVHREIRPRRQGCGGPAQHRTQGHQAGGNPSFHGNRLLCVCQWAWKLTRAGTGLNSPKRLHHGMSRKNAK